MNNNGSYKMNGSKPESEMIWQPESEEEFGRFRTGLSRPKQPRRTPPQSRQPARRPVPRRFSPRPRPPRFPVLGLPTSVFMAQEPQSQGSEYARWVQTMLNQSLNLRLPITGNFDVQTRSAIRSFQEKNSLPITGFVGPDTEKVLMGTKEGQTPDAGTPQASEPAAPSSAPGNAATEPSAPSANTEFEFEGGDFLTNVLNRAASGIENTLGWMTGQNLIPVEDRTAITARKYGNLRKEKRDLKKVYALVLHHTAGSLKEKPDELDHTNAHFVITPKGRILQLHPIESLLWASNGFNPGSVAVEFVGNFRNEKGICWYTGPRYAPCSNKPTPEQITAGRHLLFHLMKKIRLTHVLAHRQSSSGRPGDPGPDIWYHVGQWAVSNLGLNDGGPGFYVKYSDSKKNGQPIPVSWRTWGRNTGQPELENNISAQAPICQAATYDLQTLQEYLGWLVNEISKPAPRPNHMRRFRELVRTQVDTIIANLDLYITSGCCEPSLKTLETQVNALTWPTDSTTQAQRLRLGQAIRQAQWKARQDFQNC